MQLPKEFLESIHNSKGFDKNAFEQVHASGEQVTSVRFNPFKSSIVSRESSAGVFSHDSRFTTHGRVPWTVNGFYLSERPSFTFDPLFHAGCYYVQEASSMFLEQALKQTVDLSKPIKVLDLCAAPGGKSTHLLSLISKESLLVSNDVIRSRVNILNDNIIKWSCENVVVTNNDPKDFSELKNYFDVIVVDAPCSGSGLFRRDPDAMEEWSLNNVALCSQRQQRILADVIPALKNDGILIYSTCSYSQEENEKIMEWLVSKLPIVNCLLAIDKEWGIVESENGYRFWPDKVKGEGFFIACFRKKGVENHEEFQRRKKVEKISSTEMKVLENYLQTEGFTFLKREKSIHAVFEIHAEEIDFLSWKLRTINVGIKTGEIIRDKLVPDHALALSEIVSDKINRIELEYEDVILYLKKKDISILPEKKGWSLVCFRNHQLGWVNVLSNRMNNYYPKMLRILKD